MRETFEESVAINILTKCLHFRVMIYEANKCQ